MSSSSTACLKLGTTKSFSIKGIEAMALKVEKCIMTVSPSTLPLKKERKV